MDASATELDKNLTKPGSPRIADADADLHLDDDGAPWVGGSMLKLARRERAVLGLLMERRPGVVSKDEFADRVWRDQTMSDEGLAMCVSRLRRVLRDHGWTLVADYGRGYRLQRSSARTTADRASDHGYVHAMQLLEQRSPASVGAALRLLRQVVAVDPAHCAARLALADAMVIAIGWGQLETPAAVQEGLLSLAAVADGRLMPAVEAARGALLDLSWRFDEADVCFQRSLAVQPADTRALLAYSRHQLYLDHPGEALETLQRIKSLSPHALAPRMVLARALVLCGRGADAVREIASAAHDHPGDLALTAFELAIRAVAEPRPELESTAVRLMEGAHTPTYVWSVSAFVLARLKKRAQALDVIDSVLLCSNTSTGEAALYAAPLAELGDTDRAARLLQAAFEARCGMLAMVLRDPGNAFWLSAHPKGRELLASVFGPALRRA